MNNDADPQPSPPPPPQQNGPTLPPQAAVSPQQSAAPGDLQYGSMPQRADVTTPAPAMAPFVSPTTSNNAPEAVSTPVTAATPQPQPVSAQEFASQERKYKQKRRLIIVGICLLAVVIVVVAGLFAYRAFFSPFKTITYDNGYGASFRLTFYRAYRADKAINNFNGKDIADKSSNQITLFSKVRKGNKEPLTLSLGATPYTAQNAATYKHDASCSGQKVATTVYNKHAEANVTLCILVNAGKDAVEMAYWKDNNMIYAAAFFQNLDALSSLGANASDAAKQAALKQYDIDVYQQDINKILASITPID